MAVRTRVFDGAALGYEHDADIVAAGDLLYEEVVLTDVHVQVCEALVGEV